MSEEQPVRTLAVWCPDWPVIAAGHSTEEPVVVLAANLVVACSAGARRDGVRRGLRRREAQSRSPDVIVVPLDEARDARAFEPVVAAVEAVAPGVEILRPGLAVLAAYKHYAWIRLLATTLAHPPELAAKSTPSGVS